MTSEYTISYPTGLYIPVEKQSLFMVAFEEKLLSNHNVIPIFGPATKKSTCEVKFNHSGNKSYQPSSFVSDIEKASEFLRANMNVLGPRKFAKRKRKRKSNSFQTSPQVITLEDESEVSTVDLTNVGQDEHEVIVLEDSIIHPIRKTRQSSTSSSVVDLTDIIGNKGTPKQNDPEPDVKIINVKRITPKKNISSCEITILNNLSTSKKSKKRKKTPRKRKKHNARSLTSTTVSNNSFVKSGSQTSLSSCDSIPRKKRKLQDISNISSGASCSTSPSFGQSSKLSENAQQYYEKISQVVGKAKGVGKGCSTRNNIFAGNHIDNNVKSKNSSLAKKSPVRVHLEANKKRKVLSTQNRFGPMWNHQSRFGQNSLFGHNSPRRSMRGILGKGIRKNVGEANSFNPNPFEIDLNGLRPIVIDGCNVAIGHGKGKFSPKGLQICVDYFTARGHSKIKVFLPQFRQEEFSAELLENLKTKCDVLFTPSQCINGQRRTSYDDRFIVQYATEFGGVIVSTDNYRDLSRENPRWQDTIAKRLLMFTWVDDFLMFPVDPLGRSGPTLEEFLRF